MNKSKFSIILLLLITNFIFSQTTIEVVNQYPFNRVNEIVEINSTDLSDVLTSDFILTDENNEEVPYQILYHGKDTPNSLVFPVSVKTGTKSVYTITPGIPKEVKAKTFARFVPERKDDFAWENEFAAYRMYGPALSDENPSNGVDLWLKRTDDLIIDSFYKGELKHGKSYHEDHGQGLDCYKVGNSLGVCGVAPFINGKMQLGKHFDRYEILDNGPLRSVFKLTYDSVDINGKFYTQELTITVDAGTVLNKAEVKYLGEEQNIQLATGFTLHKGKGKLQKATGLMIYGENAVANDNTPQGQHYVALVLPKEENGYKIHKLHALYLNNYTTGDMLTYYFGGGWSKWKFSTQREWLSSVQHFSKTIKYPLNISVVESE